jgi:tRNA pseudouridine32 synthase/23S rRNA pseudouridine746 synthase
MTYPSGTAASGGSAGSAEVSHSEASACQAPLPTVGNGDSAAAPAALASAGISSPASVFAPLGDPAAAIAVLHADPWLLAVHKPAGLLSQPGLGPDQSDCLLSRLRGRWPQALLVHRLDQATSGLLLLALDPHTHRALSRAFAERQVGKTYLARVRGCPAARGGRLEQPLARIGTRPPRYGAVPLAQGGKAALTRWRLLQAGERDSLVLLAPRTGRSHQLRVHLALLGHPIVGDALYGDPGEGRLLLHATGLRLRHPATQRPLRLLCPPPWLGSRRPWAGAAKLGPPPSGL